MLHRFRFTLWPTVFTIPFLAVLLGLGVWQLERLEWKTALIATLRRAGVGGAGVTARDSDRHREVAVPASCCSRVNSCTRRKSWSQASRSRVRRGST